MKMILNPNAISLLLVAICHTSGAWTMSRISKNVPGVTRSPYIQSKNQLGSSSTTKSSFTALFGTPNDESIPKRKRKRKKKVQVVDVEDVNTVNMDEKESEPIESEPTESAPASVPAPASPVLDLKPREDTPVQLEVKNILFSSTEPEPSAISTMTSMFSSIIGSNDASSSGKSMTRSSSRTNEGSGVGDNFERLPLEDSLDQLLEDARLMTEKEKDAKRDRGILSDEEGTGVKQMIGTALSNIVTADFFVVLGFLAWFLLGIFCSYILKDDTVQIAFNNQFETLVQPALGVLMIAAIGGSFFNEEEQEYDL